MVSSSVVPRSCVEGPQELPQPTLADHVEPDRRLVEVEDLGVVQQRGHDVAAHPLAQAELPDRGVEQVVEVEQVEEPVEVLAVPGGLGAVDLLEQVEGVAQRQVPPERGPLAEDDTDPPRQLDAVPARIQPGDPDVAGRRAPGCR